MAEIVLHDTANIRTARWELRRWCADCETHTDADEKECPSRYCTSEGRIVRMWVCTVCAMGFFTEQGFSEHTCWEAY